VDANFVFFEIYGVSARTKGEGSTSRFCADVFYERPLIRKYGFRITALGTVYKRQPQSGGLEGCPFRTSEEVLQRWMPKFFVAKDFSKIMVCPHR